MNKTNIFYVEKDDNKEQLWEILDDYSAKRKDLIMMEKLIIWLCLNKLRLNIFPEGGHSTNDPRAIVLSFYRMDKNGKMHAFNKVVSYEDFHESRAYEKEIMKSICSEALREIEKGERWDG